MTQPTVTDDDPIRAERLANLGPLLTRIVNGETLTSDEAKLLVDHIDVEIRESTTARMLARRVPVSTAPASAGHPLVKGRCPACGGASLFLGSGGYLTCARLDCPQPDAATEVIADFWDARQHGAFTFCAQEVGHVTMTAFAQKITEKRTALAQREQSVRYANEQKERAEQAEAALTSMSALHNRNEHSGTCEHCSEHDYPDYAVPWPCPTMTALGEKPPAEDPAEDLNPAKPGTPRCTAAFETPAHGLATCWRAAVHNDREGCDLHLGETERGYRLQWTDGGPGTTPHTPAGPKED